MFLKFLNWLFIISGHAPTNRRSDKYIAAVAGCLILVSARSSVILADFRSTDTAHSVTLQIVAACVFLNNFGTLINANVREVNFASISNSITSPYGLECREMFCFIAYYAFECDVRLIPFLSGRQTIAISLMKISNFYFMNIPLFQLMLLIRRLQKHFRSLNNELKRVLSSNSKTSNAQKYSQVSSIFKDHVNLLKTIRDINSYFSVYGLFSLATRVLFIIGTFYGILKAVQKGEIQEIKALVAVRSRTVLLLVWIFYFCQQITLEANETVLLAHEMISPGSSLELSELVEQFSLSHVADPDSLSAAGLFTLDMGLMTKVEQFSLSQVADPASLSAAGLFTLDMGLMTKVEQFSLSQVADPAILSVAGLFTLDMGLLTKVVGISLTYFIVILQFNAT